MESELRLPADPAAASGTNSVLTPEVEALLDAPEAKKDRYTQTLIMAVASLMLFVGAESFAVGTAAAQVAVIVAALLLHELGHLAAMKLVGYRDVSIFFIPFLGAAASGTKASATAGQRAFVSLAGPVPGVLLGLATAVVWFATKNEIIGYVTFTLLALNLFNLLPVSPLDGGRFMDVVLFSRFPTLQLLTGLIAGAVLALLAWNAGDWFLGVLAFFAVTSAVAQSSATRLGHSVRPIVGDRPAAETIPQDVREPLARAVAAKMPSGSPDQADKRLAARMKLAWEHATLRPPGALGTIVALLGYGAAFFVPAVFGVVILVASTYSRVEVRESGGVEMRTLVSNMLGVATLEVELDEENRFHGAGREYRLPSGQLWVEGKWERGFRHGTWRGLDEDGELAWEATFDNGLFRSARARTDEGWLDQSYEEVNAEWAVEREQTEPYVHFDWRVPPAGASEP